MRENVNVLFIFCMYMSNQTNDHSVNKLTCQNKITHSSSRSSNCTNIYYNNIINTTFPTLTTYMVNSRQITESVNCLVILLEFNGLWPPK